MGRSNVLWSVTAFVGNVLGGVRGWSNVAAWGVAGTTAYILWVKPERQAQKDREARALTMSEEDERFREKTKPVPEPRMNALSRGK